jgi:putative ABC transport system permease protein
MLALAGGLAGLVIAVWGVDVLAALRPDSMPAFGGDLLDMRVLGFTLLLTLGTGVIFGLIPALETACIDLTQVLRQSDTLSGDARGHRLRAAFVAAQVALALVLLVGAGLLLVSLARLRSVDPGYAPDGLLTVTLQLPRARYKEPPTQTAFFRDAIGRMRSLPGVRAASAIDTLPLGGLGSATDYSVEGRPKPPAGQELVTDVREVDAEYFATMGIPFLSGRTFTADESDEMRHVVIVNETFARNAFPNEEPLGKRVTIDMKDDNTPCEIVGVVGDVKSRTLSDPAKATAYWPVSELTPSGMTLVVRTDGDPGALAGAVREQVHAIDPLLAISNIRTMRDVLATSIAKARFATTLLGLFAALALALSGIGIFGVTAYSVSQRKREIGIRMALGAGARAVMSTVVRRGMMPVVVGLGLGVAGAFAVTRLMAGLLFGVEATDPATFAAVVAGMAAVSLTACYFPARRAARVDPLVALRDD